MPVVSEWEPPTLFSGRLHLELKSVFKDKNYENEKTRYFIHHPDYNERM